MDEYVSGVLSVCLADTCHNALLNLPDWEFRHFDSSICGICFDASVLRELPNALQNDLKACGRAYQRLTTVTVQIYVTRKEGDAKTRITGRAK